MFDRMDTGVDNHGHAPWPWPSRDQIVKNLCRQLVRKRPRSHVVSGPLGVGKSHVLDTVATEIGHRFSSVRRIRGRVKQQRFGALISHLPIDATPAATEWQLAHQLRQTLVPFGFAQPPLLVVDDLEHVDDDSLALLDALVEAGECALLAACEVDATAKNLANATVVPLRPLTNAEASSVIRQSIGATDVVTERSIVNAAGGNPLVLHELLNRVRSADSFTQVEQVWHADASAVRQLSIEATLRERRSLLSSQADELLSLLAFSDAIPEAALPRSPLGELRTHGWVQPRGSALRLPSPAVAATTDADQAALAARALTLVGTKHSDAVASSELARWKQISGAPLSDTELVEAARDAARNWAIADALDFVQAVVEPTQPSVLLAAELCARLGDLDRASRLHDQAVSMAEDDRALVAALRAMADFHFFRRQRPDMALEIVSGAAQKIHDATAAVGLEASIVMYAEMAGNATVSNDSRQRVRTTGSRADPLARADFTANASFFDVMRGRLDIHPEWNDALEAAKAFATPALLPPHRSLRLRLSLTELLRRFILGDLQGAQRLASDEIEALPNGGPGLGIWLVTLADCERMAGDLMSAREHLVSARRLLATDDDLGIGEIAQADLAGVLAEAGENKRAREIFAEEGSDPAIFDPRSMGRRARTEVRFADAENFDACAVELASLTHDFGFVSWSAEVLYEAIRRGPAPQSTAMLGEVGAHLASGLLNEMVGFGNAVLAQDLAELCTVADRLFERRAANFGADAIAHAVAISGGRTNRVPAYLIARAREAAGDVVRTRTLLDQAGVATTDLTDRERQIAILAAQQMSSKSIAASLNISARTVDNHLGAAYKKLGVRSREGLSAIFDP